MLLTGDTIDGRTAAEWGLVLESVPAEERDARAEALADRNSWLPRSGQVARFRPLDPEGSGPVPTVDDLQG